MFVGRKAEIDRLAALYRDASSHIAVLYGRRRIGKSSLIDHFAQGLPYLKFEGLEGIHTLEQIHQFTHDLAQQTKDALLLTVKFTGWNQVFDYLTDYLLKQPSKVVLLLDELQWLAAGQSAMIALLKKYWDNHWKRSKVMLVLCGSVSSYMTKRVVSSKALYGRIDFELCLGPLDPGESSHLLKNKRSKDEIFKYLLIFGGIPKYLEQINPDSSLAQNVNSMAFTQGGALVGEYEKIFYNQFREHINYEKIVRFLDKRVANLDEISHHLGMKSSGGVKSYLDNLEKSLFITRYCPYDKPPASKSLRYRLTDEYLRFYLKFMKPNLPMIASNKKRDLFELFVAKNWHSWLGFAFENFCLKNADYLAEKMGFFETVIKYGPYFKRTDPGFQVDLVYVRVDRVITLCEIKYLDEEVTPAIISGVEKKCQLIEIPKGYTLERALISRFGPNKALKASEYFHHVIQVDDMF